MTQCPICECCTYHIQTGHHCPQCGDHVDKCTMCKHYCCNCRKRPERWFQDLLHQPFAQ